MTAPDKARALIAAGRKHDEAMTQGPWCIGYSRVDSVPILREYDRIVDAIPADAADDDPIWSTVPEFEVCDVPRAYGDTPTKQGRADGEGIAWMRTHLPELIAGYGAALDECASAPVATELRTANRRLAAEIVALTEIQNRLTERNQAALDEVEQLRAGLTDLRSSLLASSTVALSRRTEWAEQIDRLLTPGKIG